MTPKQAKFGRRVYIYIYKHRPNYGFAIRHLGQGKSPGARDDKDPGT